MYYSTYRSPFGRLTLASDGTYLTEVSFHAVAPACRTENNPALIQTKNWLDAYFSHMFPLPALPPLSPEGTPFQQLVWQLLLKIPYGTAATYGQLATQVARLTGKQRLSAQAIGQAVGKNPIAIIIPCHRVLGTGGQLTGYNAGLAKKIQLLSHEQIAFKKIPRSHKLRG